MAAAAGRLIRRRRGRASSAGWIGKVIVALYSQFTEIEIHATPSRSCNWNFICTEYSNPTTDPTILKDALDRRMVLRASWKPVFLRYYFAPKASIRPTRTPRTQGECGRRRNVLDSGTETHSMASTYDA